MKINTIIKCVNGVGYMISIDIILYTDIGPDIPIPYMFYNNYTLYLLLYNHGYTYVAEKEPYYFHYRTIESAGIPVLQDSVSRYLRKGRSGE